jgi:hypothetical protein
MEKRENVGGRALGGHVTDEDQDGGPNEAMHFSRVKRRE